LGVALFGLQRGMAPREVAAILVEHRAELRRCYRDIVAALPRLRRSGSKAAAGWCR